MTSSVLLDSPPQLPAAGAWGSLYGVQEPSKCQRVPVVKKKPAYGVKRNLEMCTEALGCETGGVDTAADDVDVGMARKKHAWEQEEETKAEPVERRVRVLPPPLTTLAAGAPRMRMVHERRDGRLEVHAVRSSGMEAERSGGRLRLRFLPCAACKCNAAKRSQRESREGNEHGAEEAGQERRPEDAHVVAKYARGGRCVEAEGGATAARRGGNWEPEQAAAFWVAIT
uniref:FAF domain-containing protein n=1 Tax=Hordeum vulgare subsp. vulgare TaxID=112509 RepID=A0A8I6WUJ7_HORVV